MAIDPHSMMTAGSTVQLQALLDSRFTHAPFVPARAAMETAPGMGNNETQMALLFKAIYHSVSSDISSLESSLGQAQELGAESGLRATLSELHNLQGSIQAHMQNVSRATGGGISAELAATTVLRRHAGIMEDVRMYLSKRGAPIKTAEETQDTSKHKRHMSPVELQWHNLSVLSHDTELAGHRVAADIQDYAMAMKFAQSSDEIGLKQVTAAMKKAMAEAKRAGTGLPDDTATLETRARRVFQAAKHMQQAPDDTSSIFMQMVGKDAQELLSRTQALATLHGSRLNRAMELGFDSHIQQTTFDSAGNITHVPQGFGTSPGLVTDGGAEQVGQLLRQISFVKQRIQQPEPGEMREHNIMPSEATKVVPLFNLVESLARSASHAGSYQRHVNEEMPLAEMALANVSNARAAFSDVMNGLHDHASKRCKECSSLKGKMMAHLHPARTAEASEGYKVLNQRHPLEHADSLAAAIEALDARGRELGINDRGESRSRFV